MAIGVASGVRPSLKLCHDLLISEYFARILLEWDDSRFGTNEDDRCMRSEMTPLSYLGVEITRHLGLPCTRLRALRKRDRIVMEILLLFRRLRLVAPW